MAGYRPVWLRGRREVVREQRRPLHALAGRTLTRVWAVWDLHDDTLFSDCPVLLDFAAHRISVFDALDENGLSFDAPGKDQRTHQLGRGAELLG
ncbi:hypothetical protein [Streptomyces cyaneofuscatus]|uniref:hypothetical protein n=1 Tax=Streptomyces cyaneofuscatus TaxID=66883 RepID=UPI003796841C